MNAKRLASEFAATAIRTGPVFVLDEPTTLDLISRAQQENVAISGIDMVRPGDLDSFEPLENRLLSHLERLSSWRDARSFVEMLGGRGLYFQVMLESAWSTRLARLRSAMRTVVRDNTSSRLPGWP